jgi:hypothetical protein
MHWGWIGLGRRRRMGAYEHGVWGIISNELLTSE